MHLLSHVQNVKARAPLRPERARTRVAGAPGRRLPAPRGGTSAGRALCLELSIRLSSDLLGRFPHDCRFCLRFSYKIRLRYGRFTVWLVLAIYPRFSLIFHH